MATLSPNLLPLMGLNPSGDLGPFTIFRTRRLHIVWYLKAPPEKSASYLQRRHRNAWRAAAEVWKALTQLERTAWNTAARLARLSISGYNLFLSYQLTKDASIIRTIERHSGISLL